LQRRLVATNGSNIAGEFHAHACRRDLLDTIAHSISAAEQHDGADGERELQEV
jgi:hypothetical protein